MPDTRIAEILARRIWDSRGLPTVEVDVRLAGGATGRGVAPAGASTGSREALELRDGGTALCGKDVATALDRIAHDVAPRLIGLDAADQAAVDAALVAIDGSPALARIGGNSAVAISLAVLQAAAAASGLPLWRYLAEQRGVAPLLPLPEVQIFGGGAHAAGRIDVQDFMIMVPGAESFAEAMRITAEVYHAAGALMDERGRRMGVADEGGWWPDFSSNEEALEFLVRAIERTGEVPGENVVISLDIAANQFRSVEGYVLATEGMALDSEALVAKWVGWLDRFPIVAIEDPVAEDDDAGWRSATAALGERVQVIGDDFLVTDPDRIATAAAMPACNSALIKINQAGTLSKAFAAFDAAQARGWGTIVSARSGETEDVSISHLAVGLRAGQLKVGSFARSERMAKWNECLRIEQALGSEARFAGGQPLSRTWWGQARTVEAGAAQSGANQK